MEQKRRRGRPRKDEQKQENSNDLVIRPIPAQQGFIKSKARYPAYVAAWGTGKSLAGIARAVIMSETYPNNLGIVFRKEFTDLRDSTIKDFENYTGAKIDSSREVKLANGSVIMFRHLEELNNIQNVNLGWFWIEQAEEIDTDETFFTLFGRLRRKDIPHCGMITANTKGHNWIYKLWKTGSLQGGELFEAKTRDNQINLPHDFLESLEILKERKPTVYRRFVENSWEDGDTTEAIIKPELVRKAIGRDIGIAYPSKKVVSIDVARYGDDKTVFYALEMGSTGEMITLAKEMWDQSSTMETVGKALIFGRKHGCDSFAVDEIGVGAGVADRISELGHQVTMVNAAKKSENKNFMNLRAEIYQNGADKMEAEKVHLLNDDEDLHDELPWAKYKVVRSSGTFLVESKDEIKKRYGRSPDSADAWLNGLWAIESVALDTKEDKYKRAERRRYAEVDPMAV